MQLIFVFFWFIAPPLKLIDLPGVEKGNLDDSLVSFLIYQKFSMCAGYYHSRLHFKLHFLRDYIVSRELICFLLSQSEYVQHNDAILLVVIPASQAPEVVSAKAIRIAKEYDGECAFDNSLYFDLKNFF